MWGRGIIQTLCQWLEKNQLNFANLWMNTKFIKFLINLYNIVPMLGCLLDFCFVLSSVDAKYKFIFFFNFLKREKNKRFNCQKVLISTCRLFKSFVVAVFFVLPKKYSIFFDFFYFTRVDINSFWGFFLQKIYFAFVSFFFRTRCK